MTPAALVAQADSMHPAGYYMLALKLFEDGKRDAAVRWFYIGQIRYRFHLAVNPRLERSGDPALFASLSETVGRPLNEYAFGDVDAVVKIMDEALAWDAAHGNGFTSKTTHAAALAKVRSGLANLRASTAAQKADIRRARASNGLANR